VYKTKYAITHQRNKTKQFLNQVQDVVKCYLDPVYNLSGKDSAKQITKTNSSERYCRNGNV